MTSRAVFWFLLAASGCSAAVQRDADLKALYDARQWFQLREAVEAGPAPAFYRIAAACVFNDVDHAEKRFRQWAKTAADSSTIIDGHGMLAYADARTGRYRQAVSHLSAMHKAKPDSAGLKGVLALFTALSKYPEPSVVKGHASEVRLSKDMFLPVRVNGQDASYGFDTGMDLSVWRRANPKALGGTARDAGLSVHDLRAGMNVPAEAIWFMDNRA